jgi:hypothetical protein
MDARGRRRTRRHLLPLLVLLTWPGNDARGEQTAGEILAAQPADLRERLLVDRVVLLQEFGEQGKPYGGYVHALVLFEQAPSRAFELLIQTARQTEYRPELRSVEIVERFERGNVSEQRMKIMLMRITTRIRYEWDPTRGVIRWALDPAFDNDLSRVEGFWELYSLDESRTLARFGALIDVGPALPAFLQDYATRKKLPEAMERTRMWIDSDGSYRP